MPRLPDKRGKHRGIAVRTTMSHITLAVLIVGFACVATFFLFSGYVRDTLERELSKQAADIAQLESTYVSKGHSAERVKTYELLTDATVLYFEADFIATRVTQSDEFKFDHKEPVEDPKSIQIIDALDQFFFARILEGETVSDIRSFEFVNREIIFAGAPVRTDTGEIAGGIVLIQPTNAVNEQSSMVFLMLLCVLAISIPIAIALSYKLSRKLTSPLITINRGARELVEGHYGSRLDVETNDELGELAGTLNTLSERLDSVFGSLREERDKLDLVMNGIGEGIIATDKKLNTVHCNQSFLRLMEFDDVPEGAPDGDVSGILVKCMRSGTREHAMWKDSSDRDMLAIASPLLAHDKRVLGAVCLLQDVSERERLEQMRRDYVANISHELRTPLTGIRGMIEPLLDGIIESEDERKSCYDVIYQETLRLEKLIKEMLDMSQLEAGRADIALEELDVNAALDIAVRRVKSIAEAANIALITDYEKNGCPCIGSEDRILQAVTVLLDNALSFTPSGGRITVRSRRERERVMISVKDTGVGIEPKDLPHVFERFYKVDRSRMRTKGTGLGLAIAKLVVERMNGEIGVNTRVGSGSEFRITLPAPERREL